MYTFHRQPGMIYILSLLFIFSFFSDQFEYISFGNVANSFLRLCGVKDEPSPLEIAHQLILNPDHFYSTLGNKEYLVLLRQVASHYPAIKTKVKGAMLKSKFLLGLRHGDGEGVLTYMKDVCLIDDTILNQIFKPLGYFSYFFLFIFIYLVVHLKIYSRKCMQI